MLITVNKFCEGGQLPVRAHWKDAGADVRVPEGRGLTIPAHGTAVIGLGIGVELPAGFMACVYPRSGWASAGIFCQLPPIDAGYTGEIHAIVYNGNDEPVEISDFAKVGQLVVTPVVLTNYIFAKTTGETLETPETRLRSLETPENSQERGTSAFGSTGF